IVYIDFECKQAYISKYACSGVCPWKNSPIFWSALNSESTPTRTDSSNWKKNVAGSTTNSPQSRNIWNWRNRCTAWKQTRSNWLVSPHRQSTRRELVYFPSRLLTNHEKFF